MALREKAFFPGQKKVGNHCSRFSAQLLYINQYLIHFTSSSNSNQPFNRDSSLNMVSRSYLVQNSDCPCGLVFLPGTTPWSDWSIRAVFVSIVHLIEYFIFIPEPEFTLVKWAKPVQAPLPYRHKNSNWQRSPIQLSSPSVYHTSRVYM